MQPSSTTAATPLGIDEPKMYRGSLKVTTLIEIAIIPVAFILIFASVDGNILYQNDITLFFRKWFVKQRGALLYLNLFECFLLVATILPLYWNRIAIKGSRSSLLLGLLPFIFLFDFLFYLSNLNDLFYLYLSKVIILLFAYSLVALKPYMYVRFVETIFKYLVIFLALKISFQYYLFLTGNQQVVPLHMMPSISMEEDTNLLVSFFAAVFLSLFLATRRWKYILFYSVLAVFLFLTFRRTAFLTLLLASFALVFFSTFLSDNSLVSKLKKVALSLSICVAAYLIYLRLMQSPTGMVYLGRYFLAFLELDISVNNSGFVNVHMDESAFAFREAIKGLPFWGVGSQATAFPIVFGDSRGIHNAYVSLWMTYSLGNLLCFLLMGMITVVLCWKTFLRKAHHKVFHHVSMAIAVTLLIFYVNAWVLPLWNVITTQAQFFHLVLLSVLLRADDIEEYLGEPGLRRRSLLPNAK